MKKQQIKKIVNKQILIVSDSADELNDIQRLLAEDFGSLLKTNNKSKALGWFRKYQPRVLVLAFQKIELAERFYLSLFHHDDKIQKVPHQTLLLCKNNESEQAYQLCKTGFFDDYVADRPLYDPFRLRLSVAQANRSRNQKQHLFVLNDQIERITLGLHQFDQFIGSKLAAGTEQKKECIQSFHYFTQKLASDLEQLEKSFTSTSIPPDKKTISQHIRKFQENSIEKASRTVNEQLNKTGDVLEEINNSYQKFVSTAKSKTPSKLNTRVILVDDDDFYLETLTDMLQDEGMRVISVNNGRKALPKIKKAQPDIVLLDYKMPELNGIETLKQLKLNPDTLNIPVIMLTGVNSREVVNQSLHMGASDYIIKPGDRHTILTKINEVLSA